MPAQQVCVHGTPTCTGKRVQHVGMHIWNSATPIQIHYINMVLPVANLGGANFSTPAAPKQLLERGRPWPG